MARFFFHIHNGHGHVRDEEGLDLADQAGARRVAIDSVRSMVAEDARRGVIDLDGRICVEDAASNLLLTVEYTEAFQLRLPAAKNEPADD